MLQASLHDSQYRLRQGEAQLAKLVADYEAGVARQAQLQQQFGVVDVKVARAARLTDALGGEQERWREALAELRAQVQSIKYKGTVYRVREALAELRAQGEALLGDAVVYLYTVYLYTLYPRRARRSSATPSCAPRRSRTPGRSPPTTAPASTMRGWRRSRAAVCRARRAHAAFA